MASKIEGLSRTVELVIIDADEGLRVRGPLNSRDLEVPTLELREPADFTTAIRRRWGIVVSVLRWSIDGQGRLRKLELELLPSSPLGPGKWNWCDWTPDPPLADRPDWEQPGWFLRATDLIDRELARIGRKRIGAPIQVRHTPITGMLCVATDGGDVWFKAVAPVFAHEARIIAALSELNPQKLPEIISSGPLWWLSAAFPPERALKRRDPFGDLADLQIAAVDLSGALGCPSRDIMKLAADIAKLASRCDLIGESAAEKLTASGATLERMCQEVAMVGFPHTIVHGDFHHGNRRWTGTNWIFYDWTDSLISHPFLDLALIHREPLERRAKSRMAYAARWIELFPEAAVMRVLELSESLGAAHQALNYERIADGFPRSDWLRNVIRAWIDRFERAAGNN